MNHEIMNFADLAEIVKADPMRPVLVRGSCCRFEAPAQDARRIIDALLSDGDSFWVKGMYCSTPAETTTIQETVR